MSVIMKRGGTELEATEGNPQTFKKTVCVNNIVITFNTEGYVSYNGITRVGRDGIKYTILCAGKILKTDVIATAGKYGEDSPLPDEVASEEEMDALLMNATDDSVGAVYKYVGTSGKYTYGQLYIISKEG